MGGAEGRQHRTDYCLVGLTRRGDPHRPRHANPFPPKLVERPVDARERWPQRFQQTFAIVPLAESDARLITWFLHREESSPAISLVLEVAALVDADCGTPGFDASAA